MIIVQSEVIDNEETKGISENWMMHLSLLLRLFIKYRKDKDVLRSLVERWNIGIYTYIRTQYQVQQCTYKQVQQLRDASRIIESAGVLSYFSSTEMVSR